MKLIVLGATGGIGGQVVEQALAAGHEVTAVVRRPSAITLRHERLEVIRGDVLEPDTLAQAFVGNDVVVSTIGVRTRGVTTLYSAGTANIIQVMQAARMRRLICISADGLEPGPNIMRWIAKPLLWRVFKDSYTDLVRMEAEVKASGLDWTIMRPPMLTNAARTGRYQTTVNRHRSQGWSISRADLSDYIVNHLCDPATYRAWVEIAH